MNYVERERESALYLLESKKRNFYKLNCILSQIAVAIEYTHHERLAMRKQTSERISVAKFTHCIHSAKINGKTQANNEHYIRLGISLPSSSFSLAYHHDDSIQLKFG